MEQTNITLRVTGMTCASCSGRAERALRAIPGVIEANVNLATETARAVLGTATPNDLIQALAHAGYPTETQKAQFQTQNMSCASCVNTLEAAVLRHPGIVSASANLASETVHVSWLPEMWDATAVAKVMTEAGYPASVAPLTAQTSQIDRREREAETLKRDTLIASALALPVFILEMSSHFIPGVRAVIDNTMSQQTSWIVQFILVTALMLGPGRRFFALGIPALLRRAPDMNALVALGTGAAWLFSTVSLIAPGVLPQGTAAVYYEAAAVIITLLLLGRYFEARAKGKAGAAITSLLGLRPRTARVWKNDTWEDTNISEIAARELVQVRPGERIAVDGTVTEGTSYVDESLLTGEPVPVEKSESCSLIGGTVNTTGPLTFKATAVGGDTVLAGIIRMVQDAQGAKLPIQTAVDQIVRWFVPAVLFIASATALVWLAFGPTPATGLALVAGVSVLIVACPCAMGLATPTSVMVGTGRAAELGVLFRKGDALQRLSQANIIAFDKTGTLTEGKPKLTTFHALTADPADTLRKIAALESQSEHPIASAICRAAEGKLPHVSNVLSVPGMGIRGQIAGQEIVVGADRFLEAEGIDINPLEGKSHEIASNAETTIFAAIDGKAVALLGVSDQLKAGSVETIADLKSRGFRIAMITGDNAQTADAVASTTGIDTVIAEVLPEGKVDAINTLKRSHDTLVFVGDGINDAPAIASADIGIAIGSGTDVAIETADLVLMSGNLANVISAIEVSRATMRNIRQNLFWAFAYNVALIPVAAGLLYPIWGILLSPMLAAGAMALSSVFVVSNALRLRFMMPHNA
ncbi:MAG: heavy metal translocating P-type ATPase [Litoreibacter sp.]